MMDKDAEIEKLKKRISGLEKTLQIVTGHSGRVENNLKQLFDITSDTIPVPMLITMESGKILFSNCKAHEIFGYTQADLCSINAYDLYENKDVRDRFIEQISKTGEIKGMKLLMKKSDGALFPASLFSRKLVFEDKDCFLDVVYDLSEIKDEEEKRLIVERQLRQTQKMEAIGKLAGGIAHDFNNMLGVIIGYSDLIICGLGQNNPHYNHIREILKAAERSRDITQQLLAFSRQQSINPKPLHLGNVLKEIKKTLGRLIGEDIELLTRTDDNLWKVKSDVSQIDQILMNLAINSKDAMPNGGKLFIEISNELFSGSQENNDGSAEKMPYVRIMVRDNGQGIDSEILPNIFEPFFTTKEIGKGTGLGLSTVYGIVKQNLGHISVESEPGAGTTFKIYFPAFQEIITKSDLMPECSEESMITGTGNILVVEDDEKMLALIETTLKKAGFNAISFHSPEAALEFMLSGKKHIDLLLADVVMPGMSGKDLFIKINGIEGEEGLKVLYMSGYSAEIITSKGILEEGIEFIQKPFSVRDLVSKINAVITS